MRNSDFGGSKLPSARKRTTQLWSWFVLPACPLFCARLEVGPMSGWN